MSGPAEGSGAGEGRLLGAHLGLQLLLLPADLLLHLLIQLLDLAVVVRVPPGRGGRRVGSASASHGPTATRGPGLEFIYCSPRLVRDP